MEDEELNGGDYFTKPLAELHEHPDFSLDAYTLVVQVSRMTSTQLEQLKAYREKING